MNTINTWWKDFFEEDDRYVKNDFVLGFIFFVLAGCIYFSKISSKLPNPDAIWNGLFYKESYHWEVSLGRYMIRLLQTLRTSVVNTSFVTVLCLFILSIICIYTIKIFDIKALGWKIVTGILIIISPTVGSTLTYYYCSDFYMLSYLLAVLAVWFAVGKSGKRGIFVSSIFVMFSAAIYQAYVCLAILIFVIYFMKMLIDTDKSKNEICGKAKNAFLSIGIGVGLYLASNKLVQKLSMIEAAEGRGFSKMGMLNLKNIQEQIGDCYADFFRYFFSDTMINNNCYFRKYINIFFFLVLAVIVSQILIKQKITIGRKAVVVVLFLLFPLISMSICILAPEVSIYEATGVLMLPTMNFVYVLAVVAKQFLKSRACGIGLLAGGASVFAMLLGLELGGQSYMQYNLLKTYNVAGQIERSVDQYTQTGKICIIGNMEDGNYPDCYPKLAESQHWLTASYKTIWSDFNGCQNCWLRFMEQYLGRTYGMCSMDEYHNIISTPEYLSMGIFPDADGVAVINGIVVVKLSDATW